MPEDTSVRQRILSVAETTFTTYGFSRVSMDELASTLAMSKKTLYKHFPTKEALMLTVIETFYARLNEDLEAIRHAPDTSFEEKLTLFIALVSSRVAVNRESFVHDTQRHAPQLWERINALRHATIQVQFRAIIEEGMVRGVFRSDLDSRFITLLVLAAMEGLTNPAAMEQHTYAFPQIFQGMLQVLLRGMFTDQARHTADTDRHSTG